MLSSFTAGLLFALGLGISGMTQPDKVLGFLDFFGAWDPSLAFVMVGAIAVHLVPSRLALRWPAPLLADRFHLTELVRVDGRVVGGSALFGVGWGLSGYCPGPGVVGAAAGATQAVVFFAGMVAGVLIFHAREWGRPTPSPTPANAP